MDKFSRVYNCFLLHFQSLDYPITWNNVNINLFEMEAGVMLMFEMEAGVMLMFEMEAGVMLMFEMEAGVMLMFEIEAGVMLMAGNLDPGSIVT